jgi:hypothetical protein
MFVRTSILAIFCLLGFLLPVQALPLPVSGGEPVIRYGGHGTTWQAVVDSGLRWREGLIRLF